MAVLQLLGTLVGAADKRHSTSDAAPLVGLPGVAIENHCRPVGTSQEQKPPACSGTAAARTDNWAAVDKKGGWAAARGH